MMLLAPLISTAEKLGTGPWHNLTCQAILVFGYMYLVDTYPNIWTNRQLSIISEAFL